MCSNFPYLGCCWETFYISAYCGLVVEIQIHSTAKFFPGSLQAPSPRSTKLGEGVHHWSYIFWPGPEMGASEGHWFGVGLEVWLGGRLGAREQGGDSDGLGGAGWLMWCKASKVRAMDVLSFARHQGSLELILFLWF